MNEPQSAFHKATQSLKWSAMTELVVRIVQPLVFVILARLLTPEDFGVVGVAAIVIGFTQMFWEAGLGKALVQTKVPLEKAANVVFWTNLGLGLIVYLSILASAGWIANFFHSPTSKPVLMVLGLQVIILSISSVQQSLFVKDLNFRQIFWAKLSLALTPAFFSIPLAYFGYGVWALVAGTLVGSFMNMTVLWLRSPWRPSLNYDWAIARRLSAFCVWIVLEGLGIWFITWGDQVFVGKYLNVKDLGVYQVASSASLLVFALFLNTFLPLLYPAFSQIQDNMVQLKAAFHKVNRIVISLALPLSAGFLLTGSAVAQLVFGARWEGLGFVLSLTGFTLGIAWTVVTNGEVYRAIGRPDVNTKFMYFQLLVYIPAYIIGVRYGLRIFVCVKLAVCILTLFFHAWLCVRMLNVSYFYLWHQGKPMILATAAMAAAVWLAKEMLAAPQFHLPSAISLALVIIAGIIVYAAGLWLLDRPFVLDTKRIALRAVSRG